MPVRRTALMHCGLWIKMDMDNFNLEIVNIRSNIDLKQIKLQVYPHPQLNIRNAFDSLNNSYTERSII